MRGGQVDTRPAPLRRSLAAARWDHVSTPAGTKRAPAPTAMPRCTPRDDGSVARLHRDVFDSISVDSIDVTFTGEDPDAETQRLERRSSLPPPLPLPRDLLPTLPRASRPRRGAGADILPTLRVAVCSDGNGKPTVELLRGKAEAPDGASALLIPASDEDARLLLALFGLAR
jgi:hypothetical protein